MASPPGDPVSLIAPDGTDLSGSVAGGSGPTALLLHGLTAHRGLVLMGSRKLAREGWTVMSFDARGHGESEPPAPGGDYGYPALISDAEAILSGFADGPAVLIGASMGAHTAVGLALRRPDLCSGLLLATPAFAGPEAMSEGDAARWLDLASVLETGGVDAFVEELAKTGPGGDWSEVAAQAARQRMSVHRNLAAICEALRTVPFSLPFDSLAQLESLSVPTVVVGSRDGPDPGHPLSVARDWAGRIPGATLEVEPEGESPLAWRGARMSDLAIELARSAQ